MRYINLRFTYFTYLLTYLIAFARLRQCASHLTYGSLVLGPTGANTPNSISIGSAVFAGLTIVADGQTDRQTIMLLRL